MSQYIKRYRFCHLFGVIVVAKSFKENVFDGHTLHDILEQVWQITESCPEAVICDQGYRGRKKVGDTDILIPGRLKKSDTP